MSDENLQTIEESSQMNLPGFKTAFKGDSIGGLVATEEQTHAIEGFRLGKSMKINAFAGTGKTSTLMMLAESHRQQGIYLAFNRSIAQQAERKFPNHVECRTIHSLAYRATHSDFKANKGKLITGIYGNEVASLLRLRHLTLDPGLGLSERSQGYLIAKTVRRYAQSSNTNIGIEHVPVYGRFVTLPPATLEEVQSLIVVHARQLWSRMTNVSDPTPLGHDGYLKCWALSRPTIPMDFILLDEAQDTNPVVIGVLEHQESQIVYVGDKHQQVYEWRGAINTMECVPTEMTAYLTQSFRFGPEIAKAATCVLNYLRNWVKLIRSEETHQ